MKNALAFFLTLSSLFVFSQQKIELIRFSSSDCDKDENAHCIRNRIISQQYIDSILYLTIGVMTNCCDNDYGLAELNGDTISVSSYGKTDLEIDKHGDTTYTSVVCACFCCFTFIYELKSLKDKPYVIKWNTSILELSPHKYFLKPVKFDILEGDTVNYFDMYGFKQGIHLDFNGDNKIISRLIYKNDVEIEGFEFRKYYDTGEVQSETQLKNKREFKKITYYRNGKIKTECVKNRCREFDKNGKLIIEYDL